MLIIFFRTIMIVALICWISLPMVSAQSSFMDFIKNQSIGKMAPDFTLDTLNAKSVNMTKFREGKGAILFFWATWCPHCRLALKGLNQMAGDFEKKGIKLFLVDIGEDSDQVRQYIQKNKITLDVFLDMESTLAEPYGIIGVPTFVFVGSEGKIKSVEHSLPKNYEQILSKK